MKKEKPDFISFYFKSMGKNKVYAKKSTGKLYIEKNFSTHARIMGYSLITLPLLKMLMGWILKERGIVNLQFLYIEPVMLVIIAFILYPLRYFIVSFEEIESADDFKSNNIEIILFFTYLLISSLAMITTTIHFT